jgi:hypothetical protein
VCSSDLTLRLEESVGHASAYNQAVHFGEQVVDHRDLVGDLRTAQDRKERPFGVADSPAQVIEFFLHKKARDARDEPGHTLGRCMRSVSRAESIVDI